MTGSISCWVCDPIGFRSRWGRCWRFIEQLDRREIGEHFGEGDKAAKATPLATDTPGQLGASLR
jgi:hypothetical protein